MKQVLSLSLGLLLLAALILAALEAWIDIQTRRVPPETRTPASYGETQYPGQEI